MPRLLPRLLVLAALAAPGRFFPQQHQQRPHPPFPAARASRQVRFPASAGGGGRWKALAAAVHGAGATGQKKQRSAKEARASAVARNVQAGSSFGAGMERLRRAAMQGGTFVEGGGVPPAGWTPGRAAKGGEGRAARVEDRVNAPLVSKTQSVGDLQRRVTEASGPPSMRRPPSIGPIVATGGKPVVPVVAVPPGGALPGGAVGRKQTFKTIDAAGEPQRRQRGRQPLNAAVV